VSASWLLNPKRSRGNTRPVSAAGVQALRGERTRTIARARATKTLKLERSPSAERGMRSAECPAEIDLLWKTAPPRIPIPAALLTEEMPE